MRRPQSLAEVAEWSREASAFWYHVMDFLDEARRLRDPAMLAEEPEPLAGRLEQGDVQDAYLAAVAVALAREIGAPPPAWAKAPSRALRRPWFAHPGATLRATLLAESPAPFRERNLFVSENALSRA
jgi:hypothetical protein